MTIVDRTMRAFPILLASVLSLEAVGCTTTKERARSVESSKASWLVGVWRGKLGGDFRGRPERTFEVFAVEADGVARGTWFVTGMPSYQAWIRVADPVVKVVTAATSYVELTRQGPMS